ncbi:hypothetical protein [Roseibium sp. Sym1]|uniref:hypothetical protein n=1 Tax=Roseibium sp. Sym1 TaxID=3016006 RepID=UPI0022B34326|nr:hypothetical protein [Roseibium sp. Sym1]
MRKYQIYAGGVPQHIVEACSSQLALERWLDEQGYDCIEHAAEEHFCEPDEICAEEGKLGS